MDPATRRRWILAALVALLGLIAYWEFLFLDSRGNWDTTDADEFFFDPFGTSPGLIFSLAVYLVWRVRRRLARLDGRGGPWPISAALLGLGAAGFVWAIRADAADTLGPSLLVTAIGAAHLLGGLPALRVLALPLLALLMAIPIPAPLLNAILWKLQIGTAEYTGLLLFAIGEPGFVSGDRIHQAGNVFAIIETCSGLRTVQTLLLLAVLMADLFGRRGLQAVVLLVLAPPVAFMVNGFRALLLIQLPGGEIAAVHSGQGVAMLLTGVLVLYFADGLLERFLSRPRRRPPVPEVRAELVPRLVLLAALFAGLSVVAWVVPPWQLPPIPARQIADLPSSLDGWRGHDLRTDFVFYGRLGRGQVVHRRYSRRGREQVEAFLVTGRRFARDRSLLSPKTLLPGSGWIVEAQSEEQRDGGLVRWRVVRSGTDRRLLQHRTVSLGGVAVESLRTLLALDSGPLRRTDEPLVMLLSTRLPSGGIGRDAAEASIASFERSVVSALGGLDTSS